MIAEFLEQDRVAHVVSIKVHVESIDAAVSVVVHDNCSTDGVLRLSGGIRNYSIKPFGVFGDVDVGCEEDILAVVAEDVECIEVVESERRGWV